MKTVCLSSEGAAFNSPAQGAATHNPAALKGRDKESKKAMAQSLSSILIHLVFSTKLREPFINPDLEPKLHAYLSVVFRECKSPSVIVGGTQDHVHALFVLHRTWTVATVVEEVKKSSSKWIKTNGRELRSFQWQAGYGAFSIGQSSVPALKRYIATQHAHHRRQTFQDEFRELLHKYDVGYDERDVWD
ncbi:MAG: transposase [Acidobacteriota bacterium]|nr:transposase [Acidobacteriota bacterium]